jgi:hypothetical protein
VGSDGGDDDDDSLLLVAVVVVVVVDDCVRNADVVLKADTVANSGEDATRRTAAVTKFRTINRVMLIIDSLIIIIRFKKKMLLARTK